ADLTGLSALDAGASTGGFTQVLLHCGLAEVWAVDVGHDQLAPTLRQHPRVHMCEGLNLRDLAASDVPAVDLVVADVSFISLRLLIDPLLQTTTGDGDRKSTRLNSSHVSISYAVFCLKKINYSNQ